MSTNISPATEKVLQLFLEGACPPEEFEKWLNAASDDDALGGSEREALARLRLIMIECGEGLRSPDELRFEIVALLVESQSSNVAVWTKAAAVSSSPTTLDTQPQVVITSKTASPA
jgi:hypothetical protein